MILSNSGVEPTQPHWWESPFRMFQTNLREIDAATLDVTATLDVLEDFGADVWLLSTGGIISNYPSGLGEQSRNPGLAHRSSGDMLGDAVAAAHARGVKVVSRMDFSKVDAARALAHPEWLYVSPEGKPQIYNSLYSVCPSGKYLQDVMFTVVDEVAGRYPIDGFFFNWWSFNEVDYSRNYLGVCQCDACQEGFSRFAPGTSLPIGEDCASYPTWVQYARRVLDDLAARARTHISAVAPTAAYFQGAEADVSFYEANNAVGRAFWPHDVSDDVSAIVSAAPDKPAVVHAVTFLDMTYRFAGEDPDRYAQYLIQALARGANPSCYIMGAPADAHYDCLASARELLRFHSANANVYEGFASDATVTLVRPEPHRARGTAYAEARMEYEGIHRMLVESRVPFNVVDISALDARIVGESQTVLLPHLGSMSEDDLSVLRKVRNSGARLVFTGDVGSASGAPTTEVPVHRVLEAFTGEEQMHARMVQLPAGDSSDAVAAIGALWQVQPSRGAVLSMPFIEPAPFGPPEKCYGHQLSASPGFIASAEAGGPVYFPWTIGTTYRATGAQRLREAFVSLLDEQRSTERSLRLSGTLSESVEVVLGRSRAGRVAHLLNRSGDRDGRFVSPVPIGAGELWLPWPGATKVRALVSGRSLPVNTEAGGVRVTVAVPGAFEVLVGY